MKNLKFFRRSKAEKESQDCYRSSSSSDNDSRDETGQRILEHRRRERGPHERLSTRRRSKYEYEQYIDSEDSIEEEQDYGRRSDNSTIRYHQTDNKRDTRRNNRDESNEDDSRSKLLSQTPERRQTPKTRGDVKLQTYRVEKRAKAFRDKGSKSHKANTSERLLAVTSFDDLPSKGKEECESKENIFPIVGFTKSSTSVSSDIIFIPVVVYPNEENEKRKERFNRCEDKQYNTPKGDEKFVYVNIQDIGSIFQQKPSTEPTTSLDTSQGSRSTNDETVFTHTKSIENKTANTGERPRLPEQERILATQGKMFNQGVSEQLDLSSQRGLKQNEVSHSVVIPTLGSTRQTAVQLHVDNDDQNFCTSSTNSELKSPEEKNNITITTVPKSRGVTTENSYSHKTLKGNTYHIPNKMKINDSKVTDNITIKDRDGKKQKMLINEYVEDNYALRSNAAIKVKPKRASKKVDPEEVKVSTNKNVDRRESDKTSKHKKDKNLSTNVFYSSIHESPNKNNYGVVRHEKLKNPTHNLDNLTFLLRDISCKPSSKSASQNESNASTFRILNRHEGGYGRQLRKDNNQGKINSLGDGKKSYDLPLTDRSGFMIKVNSSENPPSREIESQVNRERNIRKPHNMHFSDDEYPQDSLRNEEIEEKGIIGLVSGCVMEGCHMLLGTSPHSIVMEGLNVFGVVKEKMQS